MSRDDEEDAPWIEHVASVLGALGANKVKVRWRLRRWVMRRRHARNQRAQAVVHVKYEHRVCPECGALNDRGETGCVRCKEPLPARAIEVAGRFGLRVPSATALLVAAVVVVFARTAIAQGGGVMAIRAGVLVEHGAHLGAGFGGAWWRAATAVFLHGGLIHLVFNLLALLSVGAFVEAHLGRWLVAPLFLLLGVIASLGSGWMHGDWLIGVGASGAAMGLGGVIAGVGQRMGNRRGQTLRNEMLGWAALVLLFGFMVGADSWAHLFGFVAGALIGWLLRPAWARAHRRVVIAVGIAGALGCAAAAAAAIVPARDPIAPSAPAPEPSSLDDLRE